MPVIPRYSLSHLRRGGSERDSGVRTIPGSEKVSTREYNISQAPGTVGCSLVPASR